MNNKKYSLSVGIVLLIACFGFFALPAVIRIDAFIPVMLGIVLLILSIGFFFMGLGQKQ